MAKNRVDEKMSQESSQFDKELNSAFRERMAEREERFKDDTEEEE